MNKQLEGQVALVTGASRGIGAATARRLAAAGAHVLLTARDTASLEEVEAAIFEAGGSATIAPMDLVEGENIARLASAVAERWKRLDILVLNAATLGSLGPIAQASAKELSAIFTLNVMANQALIAAFDPLLRRSERARLVALTASVGATPRAYWGAYGSSKAALDTMVGAYAEEVKNISALKVALVDPGATRTKMRERAYPGEDPATLKTPEKVADAIAELIETDFETGTRIRVEN